MPAPDSDANPTLRLDGVGKWFGALQVLDGIDIDVRTREILTVLGPQRVRQDDAPSHRERADSLR